MGVPVVFSCVGEAQQPTTGRFRQSRRRICRAEIRRTEGVEASALGRETRWSTGTAREPVTQRGTLLRRGLMRYIIPLT